MSLRLRRIIRTSIRILAVLLGSLWTGRAVAAEPASFVGCPADGMAGPASAPMTPPGNMRVPSAYTGRLTLYAAEGLQVLAPRGWHCMEMYGSRGAVLLVTPHRYTAATFPGFNRLGGPAVELLLLSGENSAREQVAEIFSHLFPFKRDFIREVVNLYDIPPRYPHGPFADDRTIRRSRTEVDYVTPPNRRGMGTYASRLRPGSDPIAGTALLAQVGGVDSVLLLNVRLPPHLHALRSVILRTVVTARMSDR